MTNNKSEWSKPVKPPTIEEFLKNPEKYPSVKLEVVGDSLRKQEDEPREASRQEMFENIKAMAFKPYTAEDFTSKVATKQEERCPNCSAKENNWAKHCNECNFIGCYQCIDEHSHTPHESSEKENKICCNKEYENGLKCNCPKCVSTPHKSEDWAKEVLSRYNAEILNQFQDKYLMELGPGCEEILFPVLTKALEDFINPPNDGMVRKFNLKDFIESKAYQRGREEALSLALQEIEKEKKCIFEGDGEFHTCYSCETGIVQNCKKCNKDLCDNKKCIKGFEPDNKAFNSGLDKAKSIISGLMKK